MNMFLKFWNLINSYQSKKELYNQKNIEHLKTILYTHVMKVWDDVAGLEDYKTKKAREEKNFYYIFFDTETRYTVGAEGFTITYYPIEKKYSLSLHLGTSYDFKKAIIKSLNENFSEVKLKIHTYTESITFKDK